jgi:outer membrane lipoprotein-sorting protein
MPAKHLITGLISMTIGKNTASVVPYIKRAFRKPLKTRVQGADRRECRPPFQGLQRGNRALSGFPEGEVAFLESTSRLLSSKCAIYMRHYTRAFFTTAALLVPLCAQAAVAEPWNITQLMASLAKVRNVKTTFSETKTMHMLSEPLHSSGTLTYKAPDYLEKRVTAPQLSYFIVDGDKVTIGSTDKQERHVILFQFPALEAFIAALRGTLAGDIKTLKEYYEVDFKGDAEHWTLQLVPKESEMQLYVKNIRITGSGGQIAQIHTLEPNNDSSIMTIQRPSD